MPATEVRAFCDERGRIPLQVWLDELERNEPRAYALCLAAIMELADKGNELRRPLSDALRDGIRELRLRVGKVHYRILYFFFGKGLACCTHGIRGKKGKVPNKDIDFAVRAKRLVAFSPELHSVGFEF